MQPYFSKPFTTLYDTDKNLKGLDLFVTAFKLHCKLL